MVRIACGLSGSAVATPGLMEGPAELAEKSDVRLTVGPVSARHSVLDGKAVVENGELQLLKLDEMLKRQDEISHEWQGAYV